MAGEIEQRRVSYYVSGTQLPTQTRDADKYRIPINVAYAVPVCNQLEVVEALEQKAFLPLRRAGVNLRSVVAQLPRPPVAGVRAPVVTRLHDQHRFVERRIELVDVRSRLFRCQPRPERIIGTANDVPLHTV